MTFYSLHILADYNYSILDIWTKGIYKTLKRIEMFSLNFDVWIGMQKKWIRLKTYGLWNDVEKKPDRLKIPAADL